MISKYYFLILQLFILFNISIDSFVLYKMNKSYK